MNKALANFQIAKIPAVLERDTIYKNIFKGIFLELSCFFSIGDFVLQNEKSLPERDFFPAIDNMWYSKIDFFIC